MAIDGAGTPEQSSPNSGSSSNTDAAERSMEETFDRITTKQMRIQEKFAELSTELSIAKKQIQ